MAAGRKLFYHLPVRVNHDSRQWGDGPYSALDRNGSAVRGELQRFPGQMTIDVKVKEWSGTEKRKALTQAVEPCLRGQWSVQVDISAGTPDQVRAVQIVDRIFTSSGGDVQIVIERVVPHTELRAARVRPFDRLHGAQSR